jgi:DNA-binding transcriptional LysR family regulator
MRSKAVDIKQLKYFVEIYECKNYSDAAKKLYITPQGLSMAITRLEAELGFRLFYRSSNILMLTETGEQLLPRAREIIKQFDDCKHFFELKKRNEETIRIGCAFGAMPEFAGSLIFEFTQKFPQYQIVIDEFSDIACEEAVKNQLVELGFGLGPIDHKIFESYPMFSRQICLLVHSSHPLAKKEHVSAEVLKSFPIMIMNEESKTYRILISYCQKLGFEPRIIYKSGDVISIHRLVNANKGVGISVVSVAADIQHPNVRAIPFDDKSLVWSAYLIKKRGVQLSAPVKKFEQYAIQKMNSDDNSNQK